MTNIILAVLLFGCLINVIPNAHVVRDLGLLIDSKFSFDEHCLRVVKKPSRLIDFIFRKFKTHDDKFLLRLYKRYVLPVLDYCCQLYFPETLKNIKLTESIQVRICGARSSYTSYADTLKQLKLDTLEKRRLKIDLILLCRLIYGFCDSAVLNFISFLSNSIDTRGNGLKLVNFSCENRRHFYFNRAVKIRNNLPHVVETGN